MLGVAGSLPFHFSTSPLPQAQPVQYSRPCSRASRSAAEMPAHSPKRQPIGSTEMLLKPVPFQPKPFQPRPFQPRPFRPNPSSPDHSSPDHSSLDRSSPDHSSPDRFAGAGPTLSKSHCAHLYIRQADTLQIAVRVSVSSYPCLPLWSMVRCSALSQSSHGGTAEVGASR